MRWASTPSRADRLVKHRRKRRRRRIVGLTLLGAGVVILLLAGWVGWKAYQAYRHLETAATTVTRIQDATKHIADLDVDRIASLVRQVQADSSAATGDVNDPIYRLASHLPIVGPNLSAVSTVADVVDDTAHHVLPTMVDSARVISPKSLAPRAGAIDLAPIQQVAEPLQRADAAVQRSRATLGRIDRKRLAGPVGQAVLSLWSKLDGLSRYTSAGAMLGRLVPPMLGADGPRTYLVAFQNPAELRATGGIFGSYVVLHIDRGRISIAGQGSAARDIGNFPSPVGEAPQGLVDLYSSRLNTIPMDVNFTPDFPTAASLFAAMYRQRSGEPVDGVIAMDPVTVSYLLAGHKPIPIGEGQQITQHNAVKMLLSTAYALFPHSGDAHARDAFLAAATAKVFQQLMVGGIAPDAVIHGLQKAAGQRRVLVWSAHRSEQADLGATAVGGSLAAVPGSLGVFFNDGTGAKLGYYLSGGVRVVPGECDPQGRKSLRVSVDMSYSAPDAGLPDYVLGLAGGGAPYVLRTNVMIMAPEAGSVSAIAVDGVSVPTTQGTDHGHPMAIATIDLKPGQKASVQAEVTTAPAPQTAAGSVVSVPVEVTPGVTTWPVAAEPYRSCRGSG